MEDDTHIKLMEIQLLVIKKLPKGDTIPKSTFSHGIGHIPSYSIVFHLLPLMEDDPQIKYHGNSTYGYRNVHGTSSIIFHLLHSSYLMVDDPQIKFTEVQLMGIKNDPRTTHYL